jgi:hypothetical protein
VNKPTSSKKTKIRWLAAPIGHFHLRIEISDNGLIDSALPNQLHA